MRDARKLFTNADRELLHGILKGTAANTGGVPVSRWTGKVQAILAQHKVDMTKESINQVVFWKTNNQDVWSAVYAVLESERPGLYEKLRAEQPETVDA